MAHSTLQVSHTHFTDPGFRGSAAAHGPQTEDTVAMAHSTPHVPQTHSTDPGSPCSGSPHTPQTTGHGPRALFRWSTPQPTFHGLIPRILDPRAQARHPCRSPQATDRGHRSRRTAPAPNVRIADTGRLHGSHPVVHGSCSRRPGLHSWNRPRSSQDQDLLPCAKVRPPRIRPTGQGRDSKGTGSHLPRAVPGNPRAVPIFVLGGTLCRHSPQSTFHGSRSRAAGWLRGSQTKIARPQPGGAFRAPTPHVAGPGSTCAQPAPHPRLTGLHPAHPGFHS